MYAVLIFLICYALGNMKKKKKKKKIPNSLRDFKGIITNTFIMKSEAMYIYLTFEIPS